MIGKCEKMNNIITVDKKTLPAISENNKCCPPSSHQPLQSSPSPAPHLGAP